MEGFRFGPILLPPVSDLGITILAVFPTRRFTSSISCTTNFVWSSKNTSIRSVPSLIFAKRSSHWAVASGYSKESGNASTKV